MPPEPQLPPEPSPPVTPTLTPVTTPTVAPSVRLAMPVEALQIAEIQRRAWAADEVQRRFLDETSLEQMAEIWHRAIVSPPLAHHRVLVAAEPWGAPQPTDQPDMTRLASRVVGFAAVVPSDDPDAEAQDAEVAMFTVDELARGRGHGSRLLNAVVDTLRADGYQRALWWVTSTDDDLRGFLTSSGWAADGAHREIGTEDGSVRIKQVRLHSDISTPDDNT